MRNYRRHSRPYLLAFPLLIVSTPAVLAADMDVGLAMPNSAVARVWFLRPTSSADDNVWGTASLIYANGVPAAAIPPDAAFYHDVAPGIYRFAVEPYGELTCQSDTVELSPGTETYLGVQQVPTWEEDYPSADRGSQLHSFFVLNMSPQFAQAYLPALQHLGE